MTELESAARAYVSAREGGRLTTTAYRRLRRAWVAAVRAEAIMQMPMRADKTRRARKAVQELL